MMFKTVSFLILLSLFVSVSYGQREKGFLIISGTALGYTYDNTKSLFKKNKKSTIEGSLEGVQIEVTNSSGKKVTSVKTGRGGDFKLKLDLSDVYLLNYSKKGYGRSAFSLKLNNISTAYVSNGLILENIEITLNNFESEMPQDNGESFGEIRFDEKREKFTFSPTDFDEKKRLFKNEEDNTPINLMIRSLEKNAQVNQIAVIKSEKRQDEQVSSTTNGVQESPDSSLVNEEEATMKQEKPLKTIELGLFNEGLSSEDVAQFEVELAEARKQLEADRSKASTDEEYLEIAMREKLLVSAERELENARRYMEVQEKKIRNQQYFIYATIGVAILLLALLFLVWKAFQNKKRHHEILSRKDQKISESISYALKIQRSVLLSEKQIKAIIPKSCIFYEPLDTVSGDFYWFSTLRGKTILAAIDCTGHGVPGAFMSLIGNTLMNQIVNEEGTTEPDEILAKLHEGIVRCLNQSQDLDNAQDGMDASICTIDRDAKNLTFSGAMNAAYVVRGEEIIELNADMKAVGGLFGRRRTATFSKQSLKLKKEDRLYLFSDGYMDQFGGDNDEKFNIPRFKALLLDLQSVPVDRQADHFRKTIEEWKGTQKQTDDMLVIGVEL